MASVLRALGARRTLETGFASGLSGLYMLRAALENGADPLAVQPIHTAIDPYQSKHWRSAGSRLFARAQASHLLRFVEARSEFYLPLLVQAGERFDAVLIDGDHRFEAAFADVMFSTRLVNPGGAVLVDDTWMPSVRAEIEYFTSNVRLVRDDAVAGAAGQDFVVLRMPERLPERNWDHYAPFDAGLQQLVNEREHGPNDLTPQFARASIAAPGSSARFAPQCAEINAPRSMRRDQCAESSCASRITMPAATSHP